jgi:hypothetical protein
MRHALLAAALAAAVPVSAQQSGAPLDLLPDAMRRAMDAAAAERQKLEPAPVDPKPVAALFDRLAQDGSQVETTDGTEDAYDRFGIYDKNGRKQNLHVGVVETGDPEAQPDPSGQPVFQDLVMRRYFNSLQAQSEDWSAAKDGSGRVDLWHYTVSLDGLLLSVEHVVIPLKAGPDGKPAPDAAAARSYRMPPSDKSVQARWKALTKKLLTLGRTTTA